MTVTNLARHVPSRQAAEAVEHDVPSSLTRRLLARERVDLEAEMWRAVRAGRRVDLLEAIGIAPALATIVGAEFVHFWSTNRETFYEPGEDGVGALIVGVVEYEPAEVIVEPLSLDLATGIGLHAVEPGGSALVDLVAIELEGERVGTRLGWAAVLGSDAIEASLDRGPLYDPLPLRLVTPIQWVREPDGAAAVVDWSRAAHSLQDCCSITCCSLALGQRVRAAFQKTLLGVPPISVEVVGS